MNIRFFAIEKGSFLSFHFLFLTLKNVLELITHLIISHQKKNNNALQINDLFINLKKYVLREIDLSSYILFF